MHRRRRDDQPLEYGESAQNFVALAEKRHARKKARLGAKISNIARGGIENSNQIITLIVAIIRRFSPERPSQYIVKAYAFRHLRQREATSSAGMARGARISS